ncbi:MAG: DUF4255 domain-containing protein [Actinomycetales bacterium]|nr:DUF4255 domain-containing protein [Actinomycetales bacterium]
MLIPAVEDGLERLLRATLPLAAEQGDIAFEAPSSTWSAGVNRLTVNLYLFGISRSSQPPRVQENRPGPDGRLQRRFALPMVQLSFLVSAWAGSVRDEHALLGDVLARVLAHPVIPPEHLPVPLDSAVQLALAGEEATRPRDVWSGIGGHLKASFVLQVTLAADAYPWETAPTQVAGVEPSLSRLPGNGTT